MHKRAEHHQNNDAKNTVASLASGNSQTAETAAGNIWHSNEKWQAPMGTTEKN